LKLLSSRLLLDRAIGLKLPAKKMRFFFKRYIDFETAQGDEARLKEVKEKARQFVEALGQE
jgi:rRNA biogenesis protein RRP5